MDVNVTLDQLNEIQAIFTRYLEEKKLEKWLSDRKNLPKLFRDKISR